MDNKPVDELAQALAATEQLVRALQEGQWSASTPCSEWTVRELVNHVVGGNLVFAQILHGQEVPPMSERRRNQGRDVLRENPLQAYRDSAKALLAAFGQPGVLERTVSVPIGTVPGAVALQLRLAESLVHGWDLAEATGRSLSVPDELPEHALAFSQAHLAHLPPEHSPSDPPQPVGTGAPALLRLVALLGRRVDQGDS